MVSIAAMNAEDDPEVLHSPLERTVTVSDISVAICIYRGSEQEEWILEIQDPLGGSTLWHDRFASDQDALDEALQAIEKDGIESFAQPDEG